jgi:hypothetical protein
MRYVALALLLLSAFSGAYTDLSLNVTISVKEDGRAHVIEESRIGFANTLEEGAFRSVVEPTLDALRDLTKSNYMRYHTRAAPTALFISKQSSALAGTVRLEYETGERIAQANRSGSRKTIYSFDGSKLAFDVLGSGAVLIPSGTTLEIITPPDSRVLTLIPRPTRRDKNSFIWEGPQTLSKLEFVFEREKSLNTEIEEFLSELRQGLPAFFTSLEGIAVLAAALVFAYLYFLRRK